MLSRILATTLLVTVAVACSESTANTTTTTIGATTTAASAVTSTPIPDRCSAEYEFTEGEIADLGQESSDSGTIGTVSWIEENDCETFSIEFQTSEGAPATTPPSAVVSHLETFQVVRIRLSDVDATVVTDQLVETTLVDRLYVVRSLEPGMFVDLHLREPAQARLEAESSPARLVLTLKPGLVPITGFSTIAERVVVTTPPSGVVVDPSLTVTGYTRTFEGTVEFIATSGNDVLFERSTTAADWAETWGEFRAPLSLPEGGLFLFVGGTSAQDGTLEGATIRLTVR